MAQADEHPEDDVHAPEPDSPADIPSAVVEDCNTRSVDGCLCLQEERVISLVAEVKACRKLANQDTGAPGWLVGLLAMVGALLGNVAKAAFSL